MTLFRTRKEELSRAQSWLSIWGLAGWRDGVPGQDGAVREQESLLCWCGACGWSASSVGLEISFTTYLEQSNPQRQKVE